MNQTPPELTRSAPAAPRSPRTIALLALALVAALAAGCNKPKPAPPPPPPPPPPEPVAQDLNLDTLAQELKADARVQFAPGVTLTDDRLDLARQVIKLADAIARGEANALKPLITRSAQNVLDELQVSGAWEEESQKIEAVRIVAVQSGANIPGHATATGVVLAIQDPAGAYLLGWAAEPVDGSWVFANAPTTMDIRPRASEWDGVGSGAFAAAKVVAAEPPKEAPKAESTEEQPAEAPPPPPTRGGARGPRRGGPGG